jgi:hypothetical protein
MVDPVVYHMDFPFPDLEEPDNIMGCGTAHRDDLALAPSQLAHYQASIEHPLPIVLA